MIKKTIPGIDLTQDLTSTFNNLYDILYKNIYESTFKKLTDKLDDKSHKKDIENYIDFIIISYINNNFGIPSSIENIGRFLDSIDIYTSLKRESDKLKKEFARTKINLDKANSDLSILYEDLYDQIKKDHGYEEDYSGDEDYYGYTRRRRSRRRNYIDEEIRNDQEYKDLENKSKKLKKYLDELQNDLYDVELLETIKNKNGLRALEEYIQSKTDIIEKNNLRNQKNQLRIAKMKQEEKEKALKFKNKLVTILHPTTEKLSQLFGRNTRWCTAATRNCMFNTYNPQGNIYIIESSINDKLKFQIHYASNQLKDSTDTEIQFEKMINLLSDELKIKTRISDDELKILQDESIKAIHDIIFNDIYKKADGSGILDLTSSMLNRLKYSEKCVDDIYKKLGDKLKNIKVVIGYDTIKNINISPDIKTLEISHNIDDQHNSSNYDFKLEDYQDKLINIEKLYLLNFMEKIGNINNLPNLKELHFCINNHDFSEVKFEPTDSFSNLPNLTLLSLPYSFNDYDSLFGNENLMKHLKVIKIGKLNKTDTSKYRSVLEKLDKIYMSPEGKDIVEQLEYQFNIDSTGMPHMSIMPGIPDMSEW